ncbi:MAG: hypothetical protein GXP24_07925 [Planctomycetes bacterium]|nr:hypothetical protein [Planctomycetota bacterium]
MSVVSLPVKPITIGIKSRIATSSLSLSKKKTGQRWAEVRVFDAIS